MISVKLSTAGPTPAALSAAGATIVGRDIAKIVAELGEATREHRDHQKC